jgi:ABC-type amino acid transport substrate-binding protein
VIASALYFLYLLCGLAQAEPALQWDALDIKPWGFVNEAKKDAGIMVDIAYEVARRSKLKLELNLIPKARGIARLQGNETDFTLAAYNDKEKEFADFPACLFSYGIIALARPGVRLKKYEDLRKLKGGVGIVRNQKYGGRLDNDAEIKRDEHEQIGQMIKKLSLGRLDAVISSSIAVAYNIKSESLDPKLFGDRLEIVKTDLCLQVPHAKAKTADTLKVAKALRKMAAEGWGVKIVEKYIGTGWGLGKPRH